MNEYYDILKQVGLFKNINEADLKTVLSCVGSRIKKVKKGGILLLAGDKPRHIGVVLFGRLHIIREDYDGNRFLLSFVAPGEMFAEAMCCANLSESPVTVTADVDSAVMLLGVSPILHTCKNSCVFHTKLIGNMLELVANKTLRLRERMEIISQKSVRARVARYFDSCPAEEGGGITTPFNREELADFLCVERSALSHELSKMKRDGLIDYRKNKFILKYRR